MPNAENLLLVLLAYQNGLISHAEVLELAAQTRGADEFAAAEALIDRSLLEQDELTALEGLRDLYLRRFGNDFSKAIAALQGIDDIRGELAVASPAPIALDATRSIAPSDLEATTAADSAATNPALDITSDQGSFSIDISPSLRSALQQRESMDRFRVLKEHARGGLGVVYLAEDGDFRREVALKQIRVDRADDEVHRAKFIQEAEITGQLEHPGIVPVYASGKDEHGRPYYAMRFIRGEDFKSRIQKFHAQRKETGEALDGPTLRALLRRFLDVCDAIAYAHERKVLHRDLKPGNVMLGKHGETLVVDWGLAKPTSRPDDAESISELVASELPVSRGGSASGSETVYGSFLGTAAYAPPEQIRGELDRLGPHSDIYSLGAILFELLAGKSPLRGAGTRAELLDRIEARDAGSPRKVDVSVPKPLDAICRKAMAAKIADRYETADQLKEELERWIDDEPVAAYQEPLSTQGRRWLRKNPAIAAGVVAVTVLGLIGAVTFGSISAHHNRDLETKNEEINQQSRLLADSNTQIAEQSEKFRLTTARNFLRMGTREWDSGEHDDGNQTLLAAYALSRSSPELHDSAERLLHSRATSFGRQYAARVISDDTIKFFVVCKNDTKIATISHAGASLKIWDKELGFYEETIPLELGNPSYLTRDRSGRHLLISAPSGIEIIDLYDSNAKRHYPIESEFNYGMLSPDGAFAAVKSRRSDAPGDTLQMLEVADDKIESKWNISFDEGITEIGFFPEAKALLFEGTSGNILSANTQDGVISHIADGKKVSAHRYALHQENKILFNIPRGFFDLSSRSWLSADRLQDRPRTFTWSVFSPDSREVLNPYLNQIFEFT